MPKIIYWDLKKYLFSVRYPRRNRNKLDGWFFRISAVASFPRHVSELSSGGMGQNGPSLWGFNDRFFSVKRNMRPYLFDEVIEDLEPRAKDTIFSELNDCLDLSFQISAVEIIDLSSLDTRLTTRQGQYLYLREWNGPRRETLTDVVKAVMKESVGQPVTVDMIVTLTEERIKRFVDKRCIYGALLLSRRSVA